MTSRIRRTWPLWIVCALLVAGFAPLGPKTRHAADPTPGHSWSPPLLPAAPAPTTPAQGTALLSRQPTAFVANLGQWDGDFSHKARMGPMTVFLQERGWTFTLEERPQRHEPDPFARMTEQPGPASEPARGVAVRMHFGHGAGPALPIEEDRLPGVHNYFLGNDPDRWQSNVPLHASVLLDGLYPGIDLRARSQSGHFEYDLLVEPGADLEQVVVEVEGADGLRLDTDGTLIIDTVLGPVRQPLPKTWQVTAAGERQEVACRYVLRGESRFGFETTDWDPDLALVVDPGLVYSTFLGGSYQDQARALALDATGAATLGGETTSTAFPTTQGAYSTTHSGGISDAFVTRLDASGSALIYSTYLGGGDWESATDIALDSTGAVAVCGDTSSTNFPTPAGAFDMTYNGVIDVFVTRLDSSGSALIYSTYLGGSGHDQLPALALDAIGTVTVCGWVNSANFPTTSGAYDSTLGGSQDAFVTRLNPSGSALIYSTYLGGGSADVSMDIALDSTGAATVCGVTNSTDFPITAGALDTVYNGGGDTFVTRLDPTGSALIYSTFLGGSDGDWGRALALDAIGTVTLCGTTRSPNFPTPGGAFDTSYNGGSTFGEGDAFVTRLDPSGSALVYSTYLGGGMDEAPGGIALDPTGAATVCGWTLSTNFPITPGAFYGTTSGGWLGGAFVTRLDPSGSALIYSAILAGGGASGIALDASGTATVAGGALSVNFPTTPGAYATTFAGGGQDAFITRLDLGTTIRISQPQGPGGTTIIDNGYLIPGHEYYNIFSLDLCPAGPGTGPYLGLCATTLANAQFIALQASLPVGSPPFHFVATASSVTWGPYAIGPGTLDAVCLDVTGGVLGSYSPVTRITVQ